MRLHLARYLIVGIFVLAALLVALAGVVQEPSWPSGVLRHQPEREAIAERHYRVGIYFLEQGRHEAAIGHFKYAVALNPRHANALRQLGSLYYEGVTWNRETAEYFLTRAIELNPGDVGSYTYRAAIRNAQGQFDAAEADAVVGLGLDPDNEDLQILLANALMRQLRFEEAVDVYRRVATTHPGDLWAKWGLALATDLAGQDRSRLPAALQIAYPAADGAPSPVSYTDVAVEVGLDRLNLGRGIAWADFDGDGHFDVFGAGVGDPHGLYQNRGDGTFEEITDASGLQDPRGGWATLAADFDSDGDQDLYVTRNGWLGRAANSLYRNDGTARFVDVASRLGVADTGDGFTAAAADYDRDGHLDLYVANGVSFPDGLPNALYHNRGDGSFEEVALAAGVANPGSSVGSAWGDYNGDGYPDLYVANYGQDNALYRNRGDGTFEDVTIASGTRAPRYSFVTFFFDYNNDALLDLFVASWTRDFPTAIRSAVEDEAVDEERRLALFRNDGDGTFIDVSADAGLAINSGAMSAASGDLDNDGYLDLIVGNGGPTMHRYEPDRIFRNTGDGRFVEISRSVGLANIGMTHGIAGHDYDRDGDIDWYAAVGGQEFGDRQPNALFRNEGSRNRWLTVRLVGERSNPDAVGAAVTVWTGELLRFQEVAVGGGFGVTNSLPLEFGLGDHQEASRVEIRWPAGETQVLVGVPADQFIVVVEGTEGYQPDPVR